MNVDPDLQLVKCCQAGDISAFDGLVHRHKDRIYRLVYRMLGGVSDVDDVAQEVFLRAYNRIASFQCRSSFSTWLTRIALNQCINYLRKQRGLRFLPIENQRRSLIEPQKAAEQNERFEKVYQTINSLPPKQKAVVVLHYFEEHSCEEVADILNCSVGTEYELSPLAMDFLERIGRTQDRSSRTEMQMENADEIFSKAGDYEEAIKLYKQILDSKPDSSSAASALLKMGIAYGYLNQQEKKIETFEKAIKDYPSAINYLYLAKSFQENGEYEEAIKYYETVINEYKNASKWQYADAYIGAGESSEALGLKEQAMGYYRRILETPDLYESPKIASVEKKLLKIERGDSLPFLGLGFRHTGTVKGAYIVTVFKNGSCAAAGIQPGDVLRAIDSEPTPNPRSVMKIIGEKKIGDTVTLLIQRSGEDMEIPVTLTKTPEKLER